MSLIFSRNTRWWWKPLVVAPCIVLGLSLSLMRWPFIPMPDALHEVFKAFGFFVWYYAPLAALYTMVVGVLFVRRKEPGWTALAFLSLGLMIPEVETVGVLWLRWLFP